MAEHVATRTASFYVIFPFRSNSPLLNRWENKDMLPEKRNKRIFKQRLSTINQKPVKKAMQTWKKL
jgi:hypothetical protein